MKHFQKIFSVVALCIAAPAIAASCPSATTNTCGIPYYSIRSTHVNTVRDMVGWENLINRCDNCWYGAAALTLEFDQTFKGDRIARCLFGNDVTISNFNYTTASGSTDCPSNNACGRNNCAALTISGSKVANRGANDWLADYFGLPSDFQSVVTFCPRIRNFTADISFYLGLDSLTEGLYFRCALPITNTHWNLRAVENVVVAGVNAALAGYYAPSFVARADLLPNATAFFSGSVPTLNGGVLFDPLLSSKWGTTAIGSRCKGLTLTRLAAIAAELGWNFVCCDDSLVGVKLRATAPTGNRPCGTFLFEPIVGNGHHWEFGAGISAHVALWRCDESDSAFKVYLEGNVVHLFRSCQTRTFDLCGKPNSRYALAERLITATNDLGSTDSIACATISSGATASALMFSGEFSPVANLTRRQVNVRVAAQGDFSVKFAWETGCGFEWDLGYNFWGRSCEKFCNRACTTPSLLSTQNWALKGDASVYGFLPSSTVPIALAATESGANIHGGCNGTSIINAGIDNAAFAIVISGTTAIPVVLKPFTPCSSLSQTNTSNPPVLLTDADINLAGNKGISNKVFTHVNYEWQDCACWTPFLGIGASAEFGQNNCCDNNNCTTACGTTTATSTTSCGNGNRKSKCQSCAISQWGVWIKGGIAFN